MIHSQPEKQNTFRILSLDGGGIRGAFSAAVLAELEESVGEPLSKYFDLIAGTSTGAIIAAGIAFNIPAKKICELYEKRGKAIFARRWWSYFGFMQSRYSNVALKEALIEVFGQQQLEHASCRLLIPAINLTGEPNVVFKTPHQPGFFRDRKRLVVDILLATTAAPSFFPQAKLVDGIYADGGLWANNPSVAAYAEAVKIMEVTNKLDENASFQLSDVRLLSIGTGKSSKFLEPGKHETGLFWWGTGAKLLDVMGRSQSAGNHFQSTYLLGDNYKRVNFDIPTGQKWDLDAVDKLESLLAQGKIEATKELDSIKAMFLTSEKREYSPFPVTGSH